MSDISNTAVDETSAITDEEQNVAAPQAEAISLNDLNLLAQVVDLATQRGAFRANELTQIGGLYDKLTTFLGFVQEQSKAMQEENQENSEEQTEEE